jgi:hypothetical protein
VNRSSRRRYFGRSGGEYVRNAGVIARGRNAGPSGPDFFEEHLALDVAYEGCRRDTEELRKQLIRSDGGRSLAIGVQVVQLFGRIERLAQQIDEAFGGEPFLPDLSPDAPANIRRFNTFFKQHNRVAKLLSRAVDLWMFTWGAKREDD